MSLLARLAAAHDDPERPPDPCDRAQAVVRNLEAVLNARRDYSSVNPAFGLGDYRNFSTIERGGPGAGSPGQSLCGEIEQAIRQGEPRLEAPRVQLVARGTGHRLHYLLEASLDGAPLVLQLALSIAQQRAWVWQVEP